MADGPGYESARVKHGNVGERQKLMITGGRGMVGRNLIARCQDSNWHIMAPSSVELDLRDGASVQKYLNFHKPTAVVHAAGVVGGIHANISDPINFLADNAAMAINVIMSSYQAGVRTVINLSSSCMYPTSIDGALKEDDVLRGPFEVTNEGYALAKTVGLKLCQYIRKSSGFDYKTLIACNLYGVGDNFDPDSSHLMAAIIDKVHRAIVYRHREIDVWGDGSARREFIYAYDFADIIIKTLNNSQKVPDVMNVGAGHDNSIIEYYQLVAKVIGWRGEFKFDTARPVGMKRKLLDISNLRALGWIPQTSFEEGIRKAYEYYLTGKEIYK